MKKILLPVFAIGLMACQFKSNKQEAVVLADVTTPKQAIEALVEGNKRFVEERTVFYNEDIAHVKSLSEGQKPFAAVVACSDSRVPVELLFDHGFGDIFVIRTAGNTVIDNVTLGSVDYAVNHLGVKAVIVLGHTGCGAVTSVVKMGHGGHHIENDEEVTELITNIASKIEHHKGTNQSIDEAIIDNTNAQIEVYTSRPFIREKMEKGESTVVPAIYNISDGKVSFLK